MTSHNPSTR